MTANKDLKRLVRARMQKTGEAYTAARAQIASKRRAIARTPPPPDYAALAAMSDVTIKDKTGRTWEQWTQLLDREGAGEMKHSEIARLVNTRYRIDGWWSQSVTVGYERIKGLRVKGQRRDGTYEVGKSRTFSVPVTTLFDAWAMPSARKRWLDGATVRVRTANAPKTMRLGWADGTIVVVGFIAKGKAKSTVSLAHTRVPDKATANSLRKYWSERLSALGELLAG